MTPNLSNVTTLDHVELRKPVGPSTAPETVNDLASLPEVATSSLHASSTSSSAVMTNEQDIHQGTLNIGGGRRLLAAPKVNAAFTTCDLRHHTEGTHVTPLVLSQTLWIHVAFAIINYTPWQCLEVYYKYKYAHTCFTNSPDSFFSLASYLMGWVEIEQPNNRVQANEQALKHFKKDWDVLWDGEKYRLLLPAPKQKRPLVLRSGWL